jgi:enoyl-CoA hydratase
MIERSDRDGVAVLRMADGKANAMDVDFCERMAESFEEIRLSPARAVVMTGSGRIFSAGVDLVRLLEGGRPYIRKFLPALDAMLTAVFSHPKPVVAAINGHAIAGGCVLACAADRRLMVPDGGGIGVPELLVGVPFPAMAMEIMRCAAAPQYFEATILSGVVYQPKEAVVRGLIDELVEPQRLLDQAIAAARDLAALPPAAFALTKRQTRQPSLERLERVGRSIDAAVEDIWTADDTLDRIRAYVARTLQKKP